MTTVDPEDLHRAISSFSADAALLRHQILRVSKPSNSITLTTCDAIQAGRIREITELPLQTGSPIQVRVHQVPNEGMSRGVIHRCRPNEPRQKLLEALYADGVEILTARPMGSRGTVLICFASPHPPRSVLYWDFPRRVERYQQRSLVCPRCHNPGHKACVCPAENPVCSTCGRSTHSPDDCPDGERKYCVRCRQDGHMATEPTCPAHVAFEQKANKRDTSTHQLQSNKYRRRRGPSNRLSTGALATDTGRDDLGHTHHNRGSHAPSPTNIATPDVTYASAVTCSAVTPEDELTCIQSEMEQEHKAYKQDMQRLQKQINDLQKAVEDSKKKYAQRRKAREERVKTLSATIASVKQSRHELPGQNDGQRPSLGGKDKEPALHDFHTSGSTQRHNKEPDQTSAAQHPPDPQSPQTWQSTTEEPTWLKSFQDQLLRQHQSQERLLQQHIQLQQQLMQQLMQMALQSAAERPPSHSEHAPELQHQSPTALFA